MAEYSGMFSNQTVNPWMGNSTQAQAGQNVAEQELLYHQTGGQKGALPPVGYQTPQSGSIDYSGFTQGAQNGTAGPTTGQNAWTSAVASGQVYNSPQPGVNPYANPNSNQGADGMNTVPYGGIAKPTPTVRTTAGAEPRSNYVTPPQTGGAEPASNYTGGQVGGSTSGFNGAIGTLAPGWQSSGGAQSGSGMNGMFGGGQGMQPPAGGSTTGSNPYQFTEVPNLANGAPNYMGVANQQSQANLSNAQQQSNLNNPNYYGPGGSQVRTRNPDGSYSVTQSLTPELQQAYSGQNQLQAKLMGQANSLVGNNLSYNGVQGAPAYNTSGVAGIPNADAANLAKTRDSLYSQQTQYLDPQFKQGQSDLEVKLANQGVMPGSAAYNREMDNFAQTKQKAYGDARNSAIQAGGAEQSRQFGLGLQQHSTGINDTIAAFGAGMQGRQQGVSEANALHNAPINDLSALRSGPQVALPQYQGQTGTSIPGVDYVNAANLGYNANLGVSNAQAAQQAGTTNGLFNLGGSLLNSSGIQNYLSGLFKNLNTNNTSGTTNILTE